MQYKVYENGELINTIVADSAFAALYAAGHGYKLEEMLEPEEATAEEKLTQLDMIEAQVTYTAMMTDTLLEADV